MRTSNASWTVMENGVEVEADYYDEAIVHFVTTGENPNNFLSADEMEAALAANSIISEA